MIPTPIPMSRRARAYLAVAGGRHLAVGATCLLMPGALATGTYVPLVSVAPLWLWGSLFLVVAVLCWLAATNGEESWARVSMAASATSTTVWAVGLLIAAVTGTLASPIPPALFCALALKDFIVCRQPLLTPFEAMLEQHAPS